MMYIMRCLIIFALFNVNCLCGEDFLTPVVEDAESDENFYHDNRVYSVIYKSVNKYYCSIGVDDEYLLIYGTKKWTFPAQDVNLTLSYPTETTRASPDHYEDYIITGFRVNLFIDSVESRGYISSGGLLEESISLSFVSSNISAMGYQFWLYGIPKSVRQYQNIQTNFIRMCVSQ